MHNLTQKCQNLHLEFKQEIAKIIGITADIFFRNKILGGLQMIKMRRYGYFFILCLVMVMTRFFATRDYAKADEALPKYSFIVNSKEYTKDELPLDSDELPISIRAQGNVQSDKVKIKWESSNTNVVAFEPGTDTKNNTKLLRKGPGYSVISVRISDEDESRDYDILVKVDFQVDVYGPNWQDGTLILEKDMKEEGKIEQINLKYPNSTTSVSGDAFSVIFTSGNTKVAEVAETTGKIKPIGAGRTKITVSTVNGGEPIVKEFDVVVKPVFMLDLDNNGSTDSEPSVDNESEADLIKEVPSRFTVVSNAKYATNLTWVVNKIVDKEKENIPSNKEHKLMMYIVNSGNGNVTFNNVKAGTYEIYAYVDEKNSDLPIAYMKIEVPIQIDNNDTTITMNVRDTYDIIKNSNLPDVNMVSISEENYNAISISKGIITADHEGVGVVTIHYNASSNAYSNVDEWRKKEFTLSIQVIDSFSLSMDSAIMYTKGTLRLEARTTNTTAVNWMSSDENVVTVENQGMNVLVTAKMQGNAVITASQVVNGVTKTATCNITVKKTVNSIRLDPAEVDLKFEDYKTIYAIIDEKELPGVKLHWQTSDPTIVDFTKDVNNISATIQASKDKGGTAVVTAINEDNVVVGYCHVRVHQPVSKVSFETTDITIDPSTRYLQLFPMVEPANASNKDIEWESSNKNVATVDNYGMVTIKKPGKVTIIARSKDDYEKMAICNLFIEVPVSTVALDEKAKTMYVGDSARLSYVVLPKDATDPSVTWTSSNPSIVTVDNSGRVTAKSAGSAVVFVKTMDGSYTAFCTITVRQVPTGIKFDVSQLELRTGDTYHLKTTLAPKDSTDTLLVWESSDTQVAMVDDNGKITAKKSGTAVISARTESGAVAYCKLTVKQAVEGLILNFDEKTLFLGDTFQLKASMNPTKASVQDVTWKSSNTKVATVSASGFVEGLTGGTAIITCTTKDGGYTASCVVTVREFVTEIKLNYSTYKVGLDKSFTLVATVTPETSTNQKVIWISSDEDVAMVNSKGKVTGLGYGYATITAIAQDGSEAEASCEVRVVKPVTSVTLDKTYLNMLVGDSKKLKATVKPSNATYKTAKWKSSDDDIAIVDDDGVVTAFKEGSVTITASAKDNSGKKSICYVTVRERVPSTGITPMDKKVVMVSGEEKTVQVALAPSNSTDNYTWSSDNSAVAKVDKNTGKISARATGTANITVMSDSGKTAVIEVNVVGLNITELTLEQYTTYPYPLKVEGATGSVSWSIDNNNVAEVTNGRVSSRGIGTATITAQVNGRKLTCKLKVVKIR